MKEEFKNIDDFLKTVSQFSEECKSEYTALLEQLKIQRMRDIINKSLDMLIDTAVLNSNIDEAKAQTIYFIDKLIYIVKTRQNNNKV